jgi:Family of unknown function (DUF6499)
MPSANSENALSPLFVCRAESKAAGWKDDTGYPEIGDRNPQHWAWEFIRRNARYSNEYANLRPYADKIADPEEQASAYTEIDEFCLRWRIAQPVDPSRRWKDIPQKTQRDLVGHGKAQVFLPGLYSLDGISDPETSLLSRTLIPALQTQVLVRVCVDEDPATQAKAIVDAIQQLRKRKSLVTNRGSSELASLHDHDAPLRYVRLAPSYRSRLREGLDLEMPPAEVSYGRVNPRIRPLHLHYILRMVDAIAEVRDLQRDDLETDLWFFDEDKEKNRKAERAWRMKFPFGESAARWVCELAEAAAPIFRAHLKASGYLGNFVGRISPETVTGWMRSARWLTLEQGYAQLAKSKSFKRAHVGDEI